MTPTSSVEAVQDTCVANADVGSAVTDAGAAGAVESATGPSRLVAERHVVEGDVVGQPRLDLADLQPGDRAGSDVDRGAREVGHEGVVEPDLDDAERSRHRAGLQVQLERVPPGAGTTLLSVLVPVASSWNPS